MSGNDHTPHLPKASLSLQGTPNIFLGPTEADKTCCTGPKLPTSDLPSHHSLLRQCLAAVPTYTGLLPQSIYIHWTPCSGPYLPAGMIWCHVGLLTPPSDLTFLSKSIRVILPSQMLPEVAHMWSLTRQAPGLPCLKA